MWIAAKTRLSNWSESISGYRMTPATAAFDDRREWYWAAAVPSPYATLVEFLERLDNLQAQRRGGTQDTDDTKTEESEETP